MNPKSRISSILNATSLDDSITGFPTFKLSNLDLEPQLDFSFPTNIRLGHMAERVVSELIKSSNNYNVLHENVQIKDDNKTIGEIDFIIEDKANNQIIHMELAYKFYLYDPNISSDCTSNWIGPNRNDSLKEKLQKLKRKQFPLLHHSSAKSIFNDIIIEEVSQALCLLASLFVPYEYKSSFDPVYEKAIKGYYLTFKLLSDLDSPDKSYYIPSKKEWGMEPSENENWSDFSEIKPDLLTRMTEKQAPLCWQKANGSYSAFFIVWW